MGRNLAKNDEQISALSEEFLGYTPSNIINIVKEASRQAWTKKKEIEKEDIINALSSGTYEKIKESDYKPESMAKRMGFLTGFNI